MNTGIRLTAALTLGLLASHAALANDAVVGAIIGGGAGALVGRAVGGRDGAIVGGAVGAATGVIVSSGRQRTYVEPRPYEEFGYYPRPAPVYNPPPVIYAPPPVAHNPPVVYPRPVAYPQTYYGYGQPTYVAPQTVYVIRERGRSHHRHPRGW